MRWSRIPSRRSKCQEKALDFHQNIGKTMYIYTYTYLKKYFICVIDNQLPVLIVSNKVFITNWQFEIVVKWGIWDSGEEGENGNEIEYVCVAL